MTFGKNLEEIAVDSTLNETKPHRSPALPAAMYFILRKVTTELTTD